MDAGMEASAPRAPAVDYIGRFDFGDPNHPIAAWPGSQVVVHFDGTTIKVEIEEQSGYATSEYDVDIDGARVTTMVTQSGKHMYTLASGLGAGEHTAMLYRRTEGSVGVSKFTQIQLPGGTLKGPPNRLARRIEFIGDSSSDGYGIEGAGPSCSFSADTQNMRKAYPALAAASLNAEAFMTLASGKGVTQNYDRSDTDTMPILFDRAKTESPTPLWDFTTWTPDVVVMTIGQVDFDKPSPDPHGPPTQTAFTDGYRAFVAKVRTKYPSAHIFCALAPSSNDDYPPNYYAYTLQKAGITTVVSERNTAGDTRVHYYEFTRATDSDLTACDYHIGPAFHTRIAGELAGAIRTELGW
jgi:hypothetical protein